jgi:hypothetical protein
MLGFAQNDLKLSGIEPILTENESQRLLYSNLNQITRHKSDEHSDQKA